MNTPAELAALKRRVAELEAEKHPAPNPSAGLPDNLHRDEHGVVRNRHGQRMVPIGGNQHSPFWGPVPEPHPVRTNGSSPGEGRIHQCAADAAFERELIAKITAGTHRCPHGVTLASGTFYVDGTGHHKGTCIPANLIYDPDRGEYEFWDIFELEAGRKTRFRTVYREERSFKDMQREHRVYDLADFYHSRPTERRLVSETIEKSERI